MIRWMLGQMEKAPTAVFYEKELRQRFFEEFERARQERLLRRVETDPDGGSYAYGLSRPHAVVNDDGKIEAIDDENPEVDPIEITLADLVVWSLDLEAVARRCQQANSLKGKPSCLDDRLFFLGETHRSGSKRAFVLGLLSDQRSARRLLAALPQLLPGGYERIVVVCPTFALDPKEARLLEPAKVSVVSLGDPDPFRLDHALAEQAGENVFRLEGEHWRIRYEGTPLSLRDTKGLRYVAHLLRSPGKEIHVLELVAAVEEAPPTPVADSYQGMSEDQLAESGLRVSGSPDADALLDEQAKAEYRSRLTELEEGLAEAERFNDLERAADLREEKEAIEEELARAIGLGGRSRKMSSSVERARVNVRKQIARCLTQIEEANATLGQFFRNSVKTGTYCSYSPDRPVTWNL